ncbi:MAG TPA: hypothetical protein VGG69_09705, partial [Rhizomicrobium sp.]
MQRSRVLIGGAATVLAMAATGVSADVHANAPAFGSAQMRVPAAGLPAGSYRVAELFGESDEEKAARLRQLQLEQSQNSSISYLRQRNDDLENTVRRLTGQIEQL